jgi:hypothetical protein
VIIISNGEIIDTETEERGPSEWVKLGLGLVLTNDELRDDLFIELLLNGVLTRRYNAEHNVTM